MSKITLFSNEFFAAISQGPGVYLMRGKQGEVLYVGKARNLRNRLRSYVKYVDTKANKTGVLLAKAQTIKTILTMTEKEALLLESALIKKHKPRYNIILRDDKSYPYLKLTIDEYWPRLVVTRRKNKKDKVVFGPFSSSSAMWETIKVLNKLFPLRRCKGSQLKLRNRPCLNYQMQKCLAPCAGKISHTAYLQIVKDVTDVLSGKNQDVVNRLEKQMYTASENLDFETAALLRDKQNALKKTIEKQMVSTGHHRDQDVFGYIRQDVSVSLSILRIVNGIILSHENHYLEEPLHNDAEVMAEFITRFYEKKTAIPHEILVPFAPSDSDVLTEWLTDVRGAKVFIKKPQRGDFVKLIDMAQKNARQAFAAGDKKRSSWAVLAKAIQRECRLHSLPNSITCMDISNISGEHTVGSVVTFLAGEKDAKNYRRYKIRSVRGPDDYASMAELLDRHLVRIKDNLPDLLLVDGGKGQLNVAKQALLNHQLYGKIDILGIAKEKNDEGEKIFAPGRKNPLKISSYSAVLLLFMRIRDEAHRFGITYHRKLRGKKYTQSALEEIEGLGIEKINSLLIHFGSVKRIAQADGKQLREVKGVGPELAQKIIDYFSH